jgi:predicted ABC-type ATPase
MSMKPRLIVVAGPNGTGKTSITEQLLRHEWMNGCTYVNPDFIARDDFGDWNSPHAVIQAARKAERLRETCIGDAKSLAFETVMSVPDKIAFIRKAQQSGFFCRLFFIGTDDPSINAKRIAMRVMEGGHDVPIPKIISRYARSIANCAVAASFVDRLYVYDNSIENDPPRLMFRATEGRVEKTYGEINAWARPIYEHIA